MTTTADRPLFSVILATRNRSSLFAVALQSVRDQRFRDFEIIVVNDGSTPEHEPLYRELIAAAPGARMASLIGRDRGHGQSYALNHGATLARGEYVCFLDDDDQWIDPGHLGRAAKVAACGKAPSLMLANQRAYRAGVPVDGAIWIEDLTTRLRGEPDAAGAYVVTPGELLSCPAHCHLNTMIVSRAFYLELGGLDEGLRYECDRDFYLRAIDRADSIRYMPQTVSRHNIPDPAAGASMSTGESELSKRLYQLRVYDKAALGSARAELRRYAMRQRTYILKHLATEAARLGQIDCAVYYARQALAAGPTAGWLAVTLLYGLRRLLSRRNPPRCADRIATIGDRDPSAI